MDTTNYDDIAEQYAKFIDGKSWNKIYERPYIVSFLQKLEGKNIVDAACGSGFFTQYCLERGARVIAIDASTKMIGITKKRAVSESLLIYTADLTKPLDMIGSDSQDIVISSLTLHYLEDLSGVLEEFYRILKKGGIVLISMHHPFADYLSIKKDDYFYSGFVDDTWNGFGKPMNVRYYTRPLHELLKFFMDSKFRIVGIDEPMPDDSYKSEFPDEYEKLSKRPAFLFFRLMKI